MLRTRLIAGPVAGLVLSVAFATLTVGIAASETLLAPLRVDPTRPAPVTLRLPPVTIRETDEHGAVALRTGSTVATIALHAGVNAVPVLLPARLLPIRGFNVPAAPDAGPAHIAPSLVIASALVAALALGLLARTTPAADDEDDS